MNYQGPSPPPHLGTCSTCACWVAEMRDRCAAVSVPGQGPSIVPVRELIRRGDARGLDVALTGFMAPCSWFPQWQFMPVVNARHWCQQWQDCGTSEERRFALTPAALDQPSDEEIIRASAVAGKDQGSSDIDDGRER